MPLSRNLANALNRSLEQAKDLALRAVRMDVTPRLHKEFGRKTLYALSSEHDVKDMATGCDADMGGASRMQLVYDADANAGRFFGTLSNEVPRGAKLERSGYAAFRNRTRPSLWGTTTWDADLHPYLRLRVRNRLAPPAKDADSSSSESSHDAQLLRSALSSALQGDDHSAMRRARLALGIGHASLMPAGPKYFVNVQIESAIQASDLYQHRLVLDQRKGNAWQTVTIHLADFIMINAGQVAQMQMHMNRDRVRGVGVSVALEPPMIEHDDPLPQSDREQADARTGAAPSVLKASEAEVKAEREAAIKPVAPGSLRAKSFSFDLDVDRVELLSEEAIQEELRDEK